MTPFPPFEPDRSVHVAGATSNVMNVKPVSDGYGPLYTLATFSEALASAPRGSIAIRTAKGVQAAFVGTATAIYKLKSDGTWEDVSSGVYTLPADDTWSFDLFGERVIATNVADGAFYFDIGSSTDFVALPGTPPKAKYVSVVGDFVWLLNLEGAPADYAFSGLNDSEVWTIGERFSDVGTFPDGGEIMGCVPTVGGCYIVQRNMIRAASFNPSSGFTFTITIANEKTGCIAPRSIAKIGPGDFVFLSQDGFYRGAGATPIGAERIDRTFKRVVAGAELESVSAAVDPDEKLVYFRFQTTDGSSLFYLYDWQLDRWSQSDQNVSSLGLMVTSSLTLEDLDVLFPAGIDSAGITTDSTEFSGGRPALAGFSTDYRIGFFTGETLAGEVETATLELNAPYRSFVKGAQIIGDLAITGDGSFDETDLTIDEIDGSGDAYVTERFTVALGTADFHSPSLTWGTAVEPNRYTAIVPFRSSARLHRARVYINAGSTWNHVMGIRFDAIPEGNR